MSKTARIGIVAALMVLVGVVMALKQQNKASPRVGDQAPANAEHRPTEARNGQDSTANKAVPRLVDLGAGKCIPCKKMAPILEELRKEFAGRLDVEFIDVWENPGAGERYGVKLIPTQIFYDAAGKELYRHEGFFSREDILGKWRELGVDLAK